MISKLPFLTILFPLTILHAFPLPNPLSSDENLHPTVWMRAETRLGFRLRSQRENKCGLFMNSNELFTYREITTRTSFSR